MSLIAADRLTVTRGGVPVIDDVTLSVGAGEIVTVIGPNGSGKSTLVRALIGLEPLSGGAVRRKTGLRLGYVPQRLHLDAAMPMTVRRFLSLPRRVTDAAAAEALTATGVAGIGAQQMTRLSGGQLQRVLLARALLADPELLILDEPTQGLDQPGTAGFYKLIEEARSRTGAGILLVSHDLHVVMSASDRVICLNGHICCEGAPDVVSMAPEYRALFGLGTQGTMALYRHVHDHDHSGGAAAGAHRHGHPHTHADPLDETTDA